MFDPFKDFDTAGYLRNFAAEKDLDIVKAAEHELFRANLPEVVHHLATLTQITYADFCQVHKILFQGLYPWAGQDRSLTAPDSAVHKGEPLSVHPSRSRPGSIPWPHSLVWMGQGSLMKSTAASAILR